MLVGAHITRETGFQGGTTVSRTGKQLEEIEQDELEEIELEHVRKADGEVYAEVRRRNSTRIMNHNLAGMGLMFKLTANRRQSPRSATRVKVGGDIRYLLSAHTLSTNNT